MTITVALPDGSTAEVDASALTLPDGAQILAPGATPEGFVSDAYHAAQLESVGRSKAADKSAMKRQLKEDPALRAEILKAAGVEVDKDGNPQIPDVSTAITGARQTWESDVLAPIKSQLDTLSQGLKSKAILASLVGDDGKPLVEPRFLKPGPDGRSYAEATFGGLVQVDPASGETYAVDASGNPIPSADASRPYATPREYFSKLLASPDYAHLAPPAPEAQKGAGYKGNLGASGASKSYAQMSDAEKVAYATEHGVDKLAELQATA